MRENVQFGNGPDEVEEVELGLRVAKGCSVGFGTGGVEAGKQDSSAQSQKQSLALELHFPRCVKPRQPRQDLLQVINS